jgi:hypothetical protein
VLLTVIEALKVALATAAAFFVSNLIAKVCVHFKGMFKSESEKVLSKPIAFEVEFVSS